MCFHAVAYGADSSLQVFPDSISIQVSWPDLQNRKKKEGTSVFLLKNNFGGIREKRY